MVVSLSYRRGLGRFLVTTRLSIRRGALAGEESALLVPRGIPHLWALTEKLVATVGGDLSRAELVR